jgi:hypothetical protein
MSPELTKKLSLVELREEVFGWVKNGDLFPHFPEIKTAKDAASDHSALWVDLDL